MIGANADDFVLYLLRLTTAATGLTDNIGIVQPQRP